MNLLDTIIAWAAPARGLRRARARLLIDSVRKYEGASTGRRFDGWTTASTGANTETAGSLTYLRDRHRALVRDNPWATRAVQAIVSNTVGYGFTAKVRGPKKAADLFARWWGTTACDADGRNNGTGLEALIMRTIAESGECIVRRHWRKNAPELPVQMRISVLEGDHLDHTKTIELKGGYILQGVEFDSHGNRVAYWLFDRHPNDLLASSYESTRVPAADVCHIFRMDRPGQVRGVPWGAPVILTLRDLGDYADAYLLRQKLANCQVGVIFDSEASVTNSDAIAAGSPLGESMEPGRYEFLPPGKDIRFNAPPNAGDFGPFERACLLKVAAGYGITFQALTGDLTSVNFSSGRMGWIEFGRNIEAWRWQMLVPQGLDIIAGWFADAVFMATGIKPTTMSVRWEAPRREMIQPKEDAAAMNVLIRNGLMTLPQALRELGEDPELAFAEMAETNKTLDKLGLKLDCDPRADAPPAGRLAPAKEEEPKDDNPPAD